MTGRVLVSGAQVGAFHHTHPAPEKHDHVVLDLDSGARLTFNDARRFGAIDLWPTADLGRHRLLAGLGPEPLGNAFDATTLAARMAGRIAPVKAILLDQRVVAGLGNIYVCEALWRARISPLREAGAVTASEIEALVVAIRAVLLEAIAAGGSSLRDYRQADGELGYFQHTFAVYGREGAPCPRGDGEVARVVQSGRSSFFCPACQT
jgi:formamidopyrimidine-DNA glycosylase